MSVIQPDTFINASLEHKYSAIGEQLLEMHGDKYLNEDQFRLLKKCHGKFDCLVYEMLFTERTEALTLRVTPLVLNFMFILWHVFMLHFFPS